MFDCLLPDCGNEYSGAKGANMFSTCRRKMLERTRPGVLGFEIF